MTELMTLRRRTSDRALRRILRDRVGTAAGVLLVIIVIASLLAPLIAPYGVNELAANRLEVPSFSHPFGTDELGRDLFTRVLYGGRSSLLVGILASLAGTGVGAALGVVSGYVGGAVDVILQRMLETLMAFPLLVASLALIASAERPTSRLVIIAISVVIVPRVARIVRSVVIQLKNEGFVLAERAVGASGLRIMCVHVVPNVVPYVIVLLTVLLGNAILVEAALSFLGYGVQPPTPSWGSMLSGSAQTTMLSSPWLVVPPGVAISLTVLLANVFGDSLRDALDPKAASR